MPGDRPCWVSGCGETGEFRAPGERRSGFDGPGEYRWLCLEHVREFNARYNFFDGMSPDEIVDAQSPYGGWERETRAFAHVGADAPPEFVRQFETMRYLMLAFGVLMGLAFGALFGWLAWKLMQAPIVAEFRTGNVA